MASPLLLGRPWDFLQEAELVLFHQILLSEVNWVETCFPFSMLQLSHFPGQPLLKSCRRQHDKGVKKIFIFKVYVSFPRHGWFCGHPWSLLYLWDRNVIRCTLLTSCPIYNVTPIMDFRLIYSIKLSKWWWDLCYLIMVTFYYHYDHSMISVLEETNCHMHWYLRLNKYAGVKNPKFHWMAMGNIIGALP